MGSAPGRKAGGGYAVIEELRRRSGGSFDLPEGTIYPALHKLEAEGSLHAGGAAASAPRRRPPDPTVLKISVEASLVLAG
jgi:hypothetical protein